MATTKVIKDLTELNPGDPDYVLNSTNAVTVSAASGSNKYYFNGVYDGKFGLRKGTTVLTGIPVGHPFTILNNGKTSQITISGSDTVSGTAPNGDSYTFYYNTATITVLADFGTISYACSVHGYMGGENNLVSVYSTAGLKMPTGSSAYAAPPTVAQGMMRNLGGAASEGSVSVMQHYNGTEWKNFVNIDLTPPLVVDYLVVAGGGGGSAGGAGSGGLRTSYGSTTGGGGSSESSLSLLITTNYSITIGNGGVGGLDTSGGNAAGSNGGNSVFSTITSTGGGYGGAQNPITPGNTGGSGGGGIRDGQSGGGGGSAVTSPVVQGYNGATNPTAGWIGAAGGGGAGASGSAGSGNNTPGAEYGGNGGTGLANSITGTSIFYGGGGGGGVYQIATGGIGIGGNGGGGNGGGTNFGLPTAGTPNTGGGGGGSGSYGYANGGNGGSGVVILRYPKAYTITAGGSLTSSTITDGTDKVTTFTAGSDTITFS